MARDTCVTDAVDTCRVELITDLETLNGKIPQWDELADHAVEPNAFYESWMLLPAVRAFRPRFEGLAFAFVYAGAPPAPKGAATANGHAQQGELIAMFPFERRRTYRGLPCNHLVLWDYRSCYLGTPLVRRGWEHAAVEALWRWVESRERRIGALEFRWIPAEGPLARTFTDFYRSNVSMHLQSRPFTRAVLFPRETAEAYLAAALSGNKRRDLARKRKRLEEQGELAYDELTAGGDVEAWLEEFLTLEASGWKGRHGTALLSRPAFAEFARGMIRAGFARGRLWLSALRLDGRAIAMRCNLLSPPGSFFFKPAYDETLARYSPGVLLELETIRRVHEMPDIEWMDSCTSPRNELLNTLWLDRRMYQNLAWADYRGTGGLALTAQMLFRWARCRAKRTNLNPVNE